MKDLPCPYRKYIRIRPTTDIIDENIRRETDSVPGINSFTDIDLFQYEFIY
jgi:hypothetical protein